MMWIKDLNENKKKDKNVFVYVPAKTTIYNYQ